MKTAKQHVLQWNNVLDGQSTIESAPMIANDTLQRELEMRYGGAFAQWVMDDLSRSGKRGII